MCGGGGIGKIIGQGINAISLGTTDAAGLTGKGSMFEPDQGLDFALPNGTVEQEKNVAGDVQAARDDEKRRRAAAAGMSSTILGGSMAGTRTSNKTLLGQ